MARPRPHRRGKPADAKPGHAHPTRTTEAQDRLRPWLLGAACGLWVVRPLYPSESVAARGDGLPVVMLWTALAVFWLLGALGRRELRLRFGWVDAAVALLVGLHAVSAIWAAAHFSPRPAVNMLWEWVGFGLGFFLMRQLVGGPREARAIVVVMGAVAVALAAYGLYQHFYEMPATQRFYQENQEKALQAAGLWFPEGSPQRLLFEKRLESKEPLATFALTNSLAGYLAPWLVVLLGIGLSAVASRDAARLRSLIGAMSAAGVVAACLLLTKSRSGYLAALTGIVLLLLWARPIAARVRGRLVIALAIIAVLGMAVALGSGGLEIELLTQATKSLGFRLQYWDATWRMIADYPWAGCGPGNFQHAYTAYKLPEASEEIADPHNFLLEVWATAGTPAVLALLLVLGGFGWAVWRGRQRQPALAPSETAGRDRPWLVLAGGVFGFLLVLPISRIADAPIEWFPFFPGLALPSVLVIGLPAAIATGAVLAGWVEHGTLTPTLPAIGGVVLLVNLLAAGGIGYAGVAGTLWVLVALGLNLGERGPLRALPRRTALGLLVLAGSLTAACYYTAYEPVLRCRALLEQAQQYPLRREERLLEAARADRLSAEPWNELATWGFSQGSAPPTGGILRRFEEYTERAALLAPNASSAWHAAGERYLAIYAKTREESHLQKAIAAYRRAVDLYPNCAVYRAGLALALRTTGDRAGFQEQAEQALWLDRITPHFDMKLPDELRKSLERNTSDRN